MKIIYLCMLLVSNYCWSNAESSSMDASELDILKAEVFDKDIKFFSAKGEKNFYQGKTYFYRANYNLEAKKIGNITCFFTSYEATKYKAKDEIEFFQIEVKVKYYAYINKNNCSSVDEENLIEVTDNVDLEKIEYLYTLLKQIDNCSSSLKRTGDWSYFNGIDKDNRNSQLIYIDKINNSQEYRVTISYGRMIGFAKLIYSFKKKELFFESWFLE